MKKFLNRVPKKVAVLFLVFVLVASGAILGSRLFLTKYRIAENKISLLEEQVNMLQDEIMKITGESSQFAASIASLEEQAKTAPTKSQEEIVKEVVSKITPSVVSITGTRNIVFRGEIVGQRVGSGSGFIVSPNGYIVTNRHVVDTGNTEYLVTLPDGKEVPAEVVYRDTSNDIAIMKINKTGLAKATLGNSDKVTLGQSVVAVGNALGEFSNSVSVGIVSGLNRTIEAEDRRGAIEQIEGTIQTDAAINPGNSGGPLVNTDGEVIGVNVATILDSNNISFSIPINVVKGILKNLGI